MGPGARRIRTDGYGTRQIVAFIGDGPAVQLGLGDANQLPRRDKQERNNRRRQYSFEKMFFFHHSISPLLRFFLVHP
jgi:hypothetical protein